MPSAVPTTHPPDICLLLRVDAEQSWLLGEIFPVLRQLEDPETLGEAELDAAVAYLEVLWLQARMRAAETDAAATRLAAAPEHRHTMLGQRACRYHVAVRRLRRAADLRVGPLIRPAVHAPAQEPAGS